MFGFPCSQGKDPTSQGSMWEQGQHSLWPPHPSVLPGCHHGPGSSCSAWLWESKLFFEKTCGEQHPWNSHVWTLHFPVLSSF